MTEKPQSRTAESPPSIFEDLLEIFIAPRAVFERRRETPAFGLALIVLIVAMVGLTLAFKSLMGPVFDAEFARGMRQAMKQNPQLTPEMMQQGKAFAEKFMVFGVAGYALVAPLVSGIVIWLGSKVAEGKAEMGQAMMVATYAFYPRLLEAIVNGIQLLALPDESIKGRYSLSFGLVRFVDPDAASPMLLAWIGRIDLFTLWVTALLMIGISVMGKIPLARAAIVGLVAWVVGALPTVFGALRAG